MDFIQESEVDIQIASSPQSINSIREKFRGKRLGYEDSLYIMKDIAEDRLGDIGRTYFASLGYCPGFDDDEIYNLTKAMANSGDVIDFKNRMLLISIL